MVVGGVRGARGGGGGGATRGGVVTGGGSGGGAGGGCYGNGILKKLKKDIQTNDTMVT